MGHSRAGSNCIGCCWKPSQPQAIVVNKLSWGLARETTHWRAPFFFTAAPLSANTAALEYGVKWGWILLWGILHLELSERDDKYVWQYSYRSFWHKIHWNFVVVSAITVCSHRIPVKGPLKLKSHQSHQCPDYHLGCYVFSPICLSVCKSNTPAILQKCMICREVTWELGHWQVGAFFAILGIHLPGLQ